MKLTRENYYSQEANDYYFSMSMYKDFMECPYMAYHKYVVHDHTDGDKACFIMGNYAHTFFEGVKEHAEFIAQNSQHIISTRGANKGGSKAEFAKADLALNDIAKDDWFMDSMEGTHEEIMTVKYAGVDWKIRIDNINHKKRFFSDFKYVKSLHIKEKKPYYFNTDGEVALYPTEEDKEILTQRWIAIPFWESLGYWTRFALYQEIIRLNTGKIYEALMPVLTKETPPNRDIYSFNNPKRLMKELKSIEDNVPRILEYKKGKNLAQCGICEFCRKTKKINKIQVASSIV